MSSMVSADLFELIAAGESKTLEFRAKASIESLVAFANTQGGAVLAGVSETALVKGVTVGKENMQSLQFDWDAYEARGASLEALSPQKIQ